MKEVRGEKLHQPKGGEGQQCIERDDGRVGHDKNIETVRVRSTLSLTKAILYTLTLVGCSCNIVASFHQYAYNANLARSDLFCTSRRSNFKMLSPSLSLSSSSPSSASTFSFISSSPSFSSLERKPTISVTKTAITATTVPRTIGNVGYLGQKGRTSSFLLSPCFAKIGRFGPLGNDDDNENENRKNQKRNSRNKNDNSKNNYSNSERKEMERIMRPTKYTGPVDREMNELEDLEAEMDALLAEEGLLDVGNEEKEKFDDFYALDEDDIKEQEAEAEAEKRRSNSAYDRFFARREADQDKNRDSRAATEYLGGLDMEELLDYKDNDKYWDGSEDPWNLSRNQVVKYAASAAALTIAAGAFQRRSLLKNSLPTSPIALKVAQSFASQTAKKPFTMDQLRAVVRKAYSDKFADLPSTPSIPIGGKGGGGTPLFRGKVDQILTAQENSKVIIYHFFRSSDLNSLYGLYSLELLKTKLNEQKNQVEIVSIHSPKFSEEEKAPVLNNALLTIESILGKPISHPVFQDTSLRIIKQVENKITWPTSFVSIGSTKKVIFVATGERASASPFLSNAISATLEVMGNKEYIDDKEEELKVLNIDGSEPSIPPNQYLAFQEEYFLPQLMQQGNPLTTSRVNSNSKSNTNINTVANAATMSTTISTPISSSSAPFLSFPSDVVVDNKAGIVYICDSGNHRIVAVDKSSGQLLSTIGCGIPGLKDGGIDQAKFNFPTGLAIDPSQRLLYISDTFNHLIRVISLPPIENEVTLRTGQQLFGQVSTIRPSNIPLSRIEETKQGAVMEDLNRSIVKEGLNVDFTPQLGKRRTFRLPRQLTMLEGYLYIAVDGSNQIWMIEPYQNQLLPFIGSGNAGIKDCSSNILTGELSKLQSERTRGISDPSINSVRWLCDQVRLASPTGICSAGGGKLLVSDTDASVIREIDLLEKKISTYLGGDKVFKENLNAFGDSDGVGSKAQFQHPTGLTALNGAEALVVDGFNHKIKKISLDPYKQDCQSFIGSGKQGNKDGSLKDAEFNNPSGICTESTKQFLYIADTNNHAIRIVDLNEKEVRSLKILQT